MNALCKHIFFIIFFLQALSVFARDVIVVVSDSDLEMPLEGARVMTSGVEHLTDAEGKVKLSLPDEGAVIIQVAYPGYENARITAPLNRDTLEVSLRLGGDALEGEEIVVEAKASGSTTTKTGRSVSISGKELTRTSEIGAIEDVMTSIKLLPGVGYTGMFNAMPSIRGGEPGDLMAVYDGFYISNPYHWGGGISIFDPRMVQSATLSHGVFSARYGHTISGLLEVTSRKPDPKEVEIELGLSSSAANLNVSYPLDKGGVMLMGKVTYWEPFVQFAKLFIDLVDYVDPAPYMRSAMISADYRFTPTLAANLSGFIGADGGGAYYDNEIPRADGMKNKSNMRVLWDNSQGFLLAGLTWTPKEDMALKGTLGAGFERTVIDGFFDYELSVPYSDDFWGTYGGLYDFLQENYILDLSKENYTLDQEMYADMTETPQNWQARADYDWDLGKGFLFSAGAQALYKKEIIEEDDQAMLEMTITKNMLLTLGTTGILDQELIKEIADSIDDGTNWTISYPASYEGTTTTETLTSSAYTVLEWANSEKTLGAELGLRLDHIALFGDGFTMQTEPAFSPRLNVDWTFAKNKRLFDLITFDALSMVAGTGLFSSMADNISTIQSSEGLGSLKQNRSWTSLLGLRLDIAGGYTFNFETYYKNIFDRAYSRLETDAVREEITIGRYFDGEGRIFGFDLLFQRAGGRLWDGWLAYSFNIAQYRNPQLKDSYQSNWYWPNFHRFHNLNLVLNIKPTPVFNISTRLGFASGAPKTVVVGTVNSHPVLVIDNDFNPVNVIQKYSRSTAYSDTERDGFALTLDLKFSFLTLSPSSRGRMEFYVAIENVLAFLETRVRNGSFNQYTGEEQEGTTSATYQMPIPLPSIGFKWTY